MRYPKWVDEGIEFHKKNRAMMEKGGYDMEEWDRTTRMLERLKRETGGLFWITVNVKPDVTYSQLSDKVAKMLTKNWITNAAYAYEFRGETKGGNNGLHVHIALQRGDKRPSEAIREIRNTYKTLVGDPAKHIDIREYDMILWDDKIRYLNGEKDDENKNDAIIFTEKQRTLLNIEKIYKYNI